MENMVIGPGLMSLGLMANLVAVRIDWVQTPQKQGRRKWLRWMTTGGWWLFAMGMLVLSYTFGFSASSWGFLGLVAILAASVGEILLRDRIILLHNTPQAEAVWSPNLFEQMIISVLLGAAFFLAFSLGLALDFRALGLEGSVVLLIAVWLLLMLLLLWLHQKLHTRWLDQAGRMEEVNVTGILKAYRPRQRVLLTICTLFLLGSIGASIGSSIKDFVDQQAADARAYAAGQQYQARLDALELQQIIDNSTVDLQTLTPQDNSHSQQQGWLARVEAAYQRGPQTMSLSLWQWRSAWTYSRLREVYYFKEIGVRG